MYSCVYVYIYIYIYIYTHPGRLGATTRVPALREARAGGSLLFMSLCIFVVVCCSFLLFFSDSDSMMTAWYRLSSRKATCGLVVVCYVILYDVAWLSLSLSLYIYIYRDIDVCIYIYIYIHITIHAYTHIYLYISLYISLSLYIYIYIYIYDRLYNHAGPRLRRGSRRPGCDLACGRTRRLSIGYAQSTY